MKTKEYSKNGKLVLIVLGLGLSVLCWFGLLGSATIDDIWKVIGLAYGVGFGFIDLNITKDSWTEKKAASDAEEAQPSEGK